MYIWKILCGQPTLLWHLSDHHLRLGDHPRLRTGQLCGERPLGPVSLPWANQMAHGWDGGYGCGREKPSQTTWKMKVFWRWMKDFCCKNMCNIWCKNCQFLRFFFFWVFGIKDWILWIIGWNPLKCVLRFAWMLTRRANRVEIPVPDHRICSCGCPNLGLKQLRLWRHSP